MIRLFLDANVLFSAAYRESNGLLRFWGLAEVNLVTSSFAIEEAMRNLHSKRPEAANRLHELLASVEVTNHSADLGDIELEDKDRPILAAAIGSNCQFLITGDTAHFGHLYGTTILGVQVQTPSVMLGLIAKIDLNE